MFNVVYPRVSPGSMRALATEIRRELLAGGAVSDDVRLSLRHIESEIKKEYAVVVKADDEAQFRLGILPEDKRQAVFKCLPLTDTQDFYCSCSQQGGSFKKVALPKLYEFRGKHYVSFFGSVDLSTSFVRTENIFSMNATASHYPMPSYFVVGEAAYVYLPAQYALTCETTLIGIPADPAQTSGQCFDVFSTEWAVPDRLKSLTKERVMQKYGRNVTGTQGQQDARNNSADGNYRPTITKD